MTPEEQASFLATVRADIGVEGERTDYRDPVSVLRINLWCDAMEDQNPVYTDEKLALASVHGGLVAPPAALQTWSMRPLRYQHTAPPATDAVESAAAKPYHLLNAAGYFGVVATNCEQEYFRYLRPGDVVSTTTSLDEVSDEKQTLIGRGFFVTTKTTFYVGDEAVGTLRFRTLHYLPNSGRVSADAAGQPAAPALGVDDLERAERRPPTLTTKRFSDVAVGEQLPELVLPLSPLRIVATALASGDFEDVHHDRDAANRKGMKDIFMNILTSNGLVGRYATDWSGPDSVLRTISIRLGATNFAYDTMRVNGEVVGVSPEDRLITLAVTGSNSIGDHVVATVTLTLPE